MKFSIITPSYRQSDWLKLCIASVADQEGVEVEHIIQDSCSDDETASWLSSDERVKAFIEKDSGMYDAVNRGLKRAAGDILAYLNCDEQYLPGALASAASCFSANPQIDVIFADTIVVGAGGEFICYRQTLLPRLRHTVACHLNTYTSATFFRRSIVEKGLLFDTSYRDIADAVWVMSLLKSGVSMAHLPAFLSVFTDSGTNMGLGPNVQREKRRYQEGFPAWWSRYSFLWATGHRLRRLVAGYYWPPKSSYSIYTLRQPRVRTSFSVTKPAFLWKQRFHVAR
mgnify:CR=1 FL=1